MSGIDWNKYLGYFTEIKTRQTPLDFEQRSDIEALMSDALGFSGKDSWGTAGGFGNGTEVVVRLHKSPDPNRIGDAVRDFEGPMAARLMRPGKGHGAVAFNNRRAETGEPLNGPEHVHFQRSLAAFPFRDHHIVIHEWAPGETLEWLRENAWHNSPPSGRVAWEIIRQIICGVVIESWSIATESSGVLWDIRDANFVISGWENEAELRVVYVDTGNLRNLISPKKNRSGQIRSGLGRLKATMKRVLSAQGNWEGKPRNWAGEFDRCLIASRLLEQLERLPGSGNAKRTEAEAATKELMEDLVKKGLLNPLD